MSTTSQNVTAAEARDGKVAKSMAAHSSAIKAKQSKARAAKRAKAAKAKPTTRTKSPKTTPDKAEVDPRAATLMAWRKTADAPAEVLAVVDAAIRRATATPRATSVKAEPSDVAAFFESTGLSRKELAEAVGVSTSVISTVQRENGDRWSLVRFEAAKPMILAAVEKQRKAKGSSAKSD